MARHGTSDPWKEMGGRSGETTRDTTLRFLPCLLCVAALLGCAHRPPSPLADATQAQLGTIGVVVAPAPPKVDYRTPGQGGKSGAAIGAAKGLGLGVLGAVGCLGALGGCAQCVAGCALVVATPYLATRYAIDQATEGVPADTIQAAETAITAVLAERTHQAVVRDAVSRLAAAHTPRTLVPHPGECCPPAAGTTTYRPLAAHGIDTVIEITLQRLALQSRTSGRAGGDSLGRIGAATLNPYLTLAVTARTRVLRTADGTVLYDHAGEHTGRGATFPDWGANDAQLLRDGLDQLFQEMAREIVAQVFGVAIPPVREPEAPTAPNPEQDRAPKPQPSTSDAERPSSE
jgi:hypothetical protein